MVSTYLSYDLVNRDLKASLARTASDSVVARQTAYFQENISKVSSVEEFLDDYQLYSYAMKAHGLEEMTYAKAFIKKVLESDLSDDASFANQLTDDRYRNFAAAFQFTPQTTDVQSDTQKSEMLDMYEASLAAESEALEVESKYYDTTIDTITSAQGLVGNKRLLEYALSAYGIDGTYYTKDHFVKVLTSDLSDSNSYVNQLVTKGASGAANLLKLAQAYGFESDGSLTGTTAQTAEQKDDTISLYVEEEQTYVSDYYLEREKSYYASKIATVTDISQITSDSRLFNYVKTAFQLGATATSSTLQQIVKSDLTDPENYALKNGGEAWVEVAKKFNFATDGTVKAGFAAQDSAQIASTDTGFATYYDDADETKQTALLELFDTNMEKVTNVDDLLENSTTLLVLQRSFDFDATEFTKEELSKALTSDFTDPASYANKSKDSRLIAMSQLFNFDSNGDADVPLQAHSPLTATMIAKEFIVNEIRFLDKTETVTAKETATKAATYYQEKIQGIRSVDELLADRGVIDVVLGAFGLDASDTSDDFLKQIFASDLSDPKSFVNQQSSNRWAEMTASFNFDSDGVLTRATSGTIQQRGETLETVNLYLRQTLEENEGESNEAVRLALYFQRTAPTMTDAYDMIADDALMEVFRITFGYTDDFSSMDVDAQAKVINAKLDLADLQDPDKMTRYLERFTAMYDTENASYENSAVSILSGGGTISADLLFSIAQLKY